MSAEAPAEASALPGGDLGGLIDGPQGGPARAIDWLRRNLFSSVTNTLLTLLDRAGFGELEVGDWRRSLQIGGGLPAAEAANFALASFSSFGELLAEAGDEALNHARQSLTSRFSRHQQEGAVRLDACVHIFTGARLGSISAPDPG